MIDVLTVDNLYLNYNLYGLYQTGWTSNVRIRNLFGYLNLRSLLHADAKYDSPIDSCPAPTLHGPSIAPLHARLQQPTTKSLVGGVHGHSWGHGERV